MNTTIALVILHVLFVSTIGKAAFLCCPTHFPRRATALRVSELHVPGYAKSKLAFILDEDQDEDQSTGGGRTGNCRGIYKLDKNQDLDFEAMIPHSDGHLLFKTTRPILMPDECQKVLVEAEAVAAEIDWTKNRHGNFPTTDLPIVELPQTLQFIRHALVERIYPMLAKQFGSFLPDASKLRVADGFVVKYDAAGGQKELKPHRDGSVVSFNIALNPSHEYDGGGTWFSSLGDEAVVKIEQGEIVSHASALLHGGHGITWGKRYILVAFVILEGYDSWSMRFYNQVRNL